MMAMWTLDELVERVREALTAEYPGAPNGRVRELPDRRAIRWYTTIGLVDKPIGMRGRTALYGPRHLEQLVAIKRRQAEGRTLSQIQGEFTFLSPGALTEVARVPGHLLANDGNHVVDEPVRSRFWAAPPSAVASAEPAEPAGRFHGDVTTRSLTGVVLGGGVVLLVPREVSDRDRADIAAAAAPLLDLLTTRGLTDGSPS